MACNRRGGRGVVKVAGQIRGSKEVIVGREATLDLTIKLQPEKKMVRE